MDAIGNLEVRWAQGISKQLVEFIETKTACYTCGNYIVFLNVESKRRTVLQSPGRGIGTFTANGVSNVLAFSEQKLNPSIFVFNYPELKLINELKGTAKLDYTSLALSVGSPHLCCCSSLPDYTITVWNWETAEQICTQPQAGKDVISLVFNPMNWLQISALGTTNLTVWNIEKSDTLHIMKKRNIHLPGVDGNLIEKESPFSHIANDRLTYWGPRMPASAIAGLTGDRAEHFSPQECIPTRLTPITVCWTGTSELYVGCREGFLLLADPETLSVSVLFSPTAATAIPGLEKSGFQSLALHRDGLYAAGKDSVIHCLKIKGSQIEITQTLDLMEPVQTIVYSPDYESLLLSSNSGKIYRYRPFQSEEMDKILDVLSGNFVAGASLPTGQDVFVSVRDFGELQLWSSAGFCIGSLSLQTEVTSMVCCPIAHCAAVGTASGHVLFIDLSSEHKPRLVHKVRLHRRPVDHLVQGGHFLLTSASDCHVFLLEARPSKIFAVIGYTVVPGPILSLSTQYIRDSKVVKVLALCTGLQDNEHEGCLLNLLTLSVNDLSGQLCADPHGCLSNNTIQSCTYEVPHALQSCVLGVGEVFAYCQRKKALQRFSLPKNTDCVSSQSVVQLKPEEEVEGHPLGPASLVLSPHNLWLVSVGRDGLLRVRMTASMDRYAEIQCHSCRLGGVRSVSFSADSQTLLTAGLADGSFVCTRLRMKVAGTGKAKEATHYGQTVALSFENVLKSENPVLSGMPQWEQGSLTGSDSTQLAKEEGRESRGNMDVMEQDEIYTNLISATDPDPTWLEGKKEVVIKAECQRYSEEKEKIKKGIKELCATIQDMMLENVNLPDVWHLDQHEFNLDLEEQRRLEAEGEQEVARVRKEIEMENLSKCYLRDVLKRDCWDSMKVKGKAIKGFHSELEVKNYPMRERTEKELEDFRRVESVRTIEKAESIVVSQNAQVRQDIPERRSKEAAKKEEEEEEEDGDTDSQKPALTGSLAGQLGCSNPLLYHQFNLHIRERKINQITLLQDVIYKVKTSFNTEFEEIHKRKEQEINRVKDKNRRIEEIMEELGINQTLWEPGLSHTEQPQRCLTVDDSEIKIEKCLSPEQRKEEEKKKMEEQMHLAAKGHHFKERALDDMMGGALKVKREDILKKEIPQPEFVLGKPKLQWSEEEKKISREYEKKASELSQEQDKYRKNLESEMKKLQVSIMESTQGADEVLSKLFERKVNSEMVIHQEELKIGNLLHSMLIEEEIRNREAELTHKLERKRADKIEFGKELQSLKENVELFRETYDNAVAEDKLLDKGFRKQFFDVPAHVVDHLYRLYKHRPRVQRMRAQVDNISPFNERPLCGSITNDGLSQRLKAMEELDSPENMPESLDPSIWERFCLARRASVESEQQVKMKALTLAEMQAFLHKRTDEDDNAKQEIKALIDELTGLREEKIRFQLDIMVQVLIKQGQVEVAPTDFIADHRDSVLHHRHVVEDLNATIKTLVEQKIATMVEGKDFQKGIIQQVCEHKQVEMQIGHFNMEARDIQTLHVSKELDCHSKTDQENTVLNHASTLENTFLEEKTHDKNVQSRKEKITQLNMQSAFKAEKNTILDQELANMEAIVAERRRVYETTDNQELETEERYQEIVHRKRMVDLAKTQAEELIFLWIELELLRMKNFPALN